MKFRLSDYIDFTKRNTRGIFAILCIALLVKVGPQLYFQFQPQSKLPIDTAFAAAVAQLTISDTISNWQRPTFQNNKYKEYSAYNRFEDEGDLPKSEFFFDPNTASSEDWTKLGIKAKTVATIQNYLSKGGRFRDPDDISKIWGLSEEDAERLMPFVRIVPSNNGYAKYEKTSSGNDKLAYVKAAPSIVDINLSDTTAYIALPGIGSKLAQRIINYRDKLGGFYSISQVGETFGLPDSTFQKIKSRLVLGNAGVKKININTAAIEELKAHPYIRWQQGNLIIKYRTQHGNYKSVEEIRKIKTVDDIFYNKVAPYLVVN